MRRIALAAVITAATCTTLLIVPAVAAVEPAGPQPQGQQQQPPPPPQRYEERVVVTASRFEQLLFDAPTAITIIDGQLIELSPAANYADLLRSVPGLNVSQTSARDINMTSRAATNTLATTQLVLVDGRAVYQDFFGFVLWDLLPISFAEVEQIEVQRGPSSAVWGANAMTGVINVRTKSPRSLGNATTIRGGGGERGSGFFSALHSGVRDDWAYKVSGSYYTQDAWPRPATLSGQVFPDSANRGTKQPKFDARVDRRLDAVTGLSFSGGYAGTSGIIHTGIGPFDIEDGSWFSYLRADYDRDQINARFYVNLLSADSVNLLNALPFDFKTQTYDWSAQNTSMFRDGEHIVVYGGNFRYQTFDLSIGPNADNRSEGGAFVQDSWSPHEQILVTAGVRGDGFSVLDKPVWSPRIGVQVRPMAGRDHAVRVSWGRAFRAPSTINNFLDTQIFNTIDLSPLAPLLGFNPGLYTFPIAAVGNPSLVEEQLDQIEVGYRAVIGGDVAIDFAYYQTETKDNIDFFAATFYGPTDPPPAWPLPAFILGLLPQPLPKSFTYRNIGLTTNQGVELGVRARVYPRNEVFANYTWQKNPEVEDIDPAEINVPAENVFNVGLTGWYQGFLYSVAVNYIGEAFWADVLDSRFHGPTEAATTLNLTFGYEYRNVDLSVRATNVTDEAFQQHYFGDIIGRRVVAEAGVSFDWDNR
jgi:iron complex outermembrane receptor protein